jgi:lysophospholipase L1-like esterase
MKKNYNRFIALVFITAICACEQEVISLKQPEAVTPTADCPEDASAGTVNMTKFIAIGNSLVAGVQGGALFTTGQNNSLAAILNKQFECVGAPATFKQPDIGASLGWNLFVTQPFLTDNTKPILGRMLLQYNGSSSPRPTPQPYAPGVLEALPNPQFNPGFMYAGSKTELNNFSVPAITVGQVLTPAAGGPPIDENPAFTPFYLRFASDPSADGTTGSRILTDALASGGTFALVWLGLDDFFLYAAFGGDPDEAPITDPTDFATRYGAVFGHPQIGLFTVNPQLKVVIGNFPDIFKMPYFTSVPWNAIEFTDAQAATVTATNGAYAPYNAGLDLAAQGGAITNAERDRRKISFVVGANGIVMEDESLADLSGLGLPSIRQATTGDVFPLIAATVLGTQAVPGNPATTWGVGKALTDKYALIPDELTEINSARTAYNATVQAVANTFATNVALADIDAALNSLFAAKAGVYNGLTITPNINPPTGIYSEDGVHPNTRGYAFLSRIFIQAINDKFGASIPLTDISKYPATGLPIP